MPTKHEVFYSKQSCGQSGSVPFIKFDNLSNSQSQSNPRQYHHTRFFSSSFFQFHTYPMHHRHKHKALHCEIKDHTSNRLCLWTRCATTSPTDRNPLSSSSHHHKHNQSYQLHSKENQIGTKYFVSK